MMGRNWMMSSYQQDAYRAVYYKIWLDNKELSPFEHSLVEEIKFEDTSTGSDMVSIVIKDPDYTFISNLKLTKSTPVKVVGGYKDQYRTWINGYISMVDVDFPEEGTPEVVIHVMDKTYIMNRIVRKRTFKNMTYTQVAKKIAQAYGLSFSGDTSGKGKEKHETITQSYETDIQFLVGLADEIGYLVYMSADGTKLYFKDKESFEKKAPSYTLWYKRPPFDIISFRPRIIQADQFDEIMESDIDNKTKKETGSKSVKK